MAFCFDAAGRTNGFYELPGPVADVRIVFLWNWVWLFRQIANTRDVLCGGGGMDH